MLEETHSAAGAARLGCELPPEAFDDREGYCRRLGHYVSFAYCRGVGSLPCSRIADCWFERLPVEAYLRANYSPAELGAMLAPAPPKLESILEIAARVRAQAEFQA